MDELWKTVFEESVDSYEAIQTLQDHGLLDDEEKAVIEHNLLFNIIKVMKWELGEL